LTHLPRVIFSGSRNFRDPAPIRAALESLRKKGDWKVVHGAARGLDSLAGELAPEYSFEVEAHPADWDKHKKAAGPIRNQKMVDLGACVAFAFPLEESRGTWDFIRRARKAQIPVLCWEAGVFRQIP
jgi:hypothetical protein